MRIATSAIIRPAGPIISLVMLLFTLSACNNIIEIVPVTALTPTPVTAQIQEDITEVQTLGDAPSRIVSDVIKLDAPVVEMGWSIVEENGDLISRWDMPTNEAAWHRNSARPGQGSNIVISGHNESTGGQVFSEIEELQVGDEITLWAGTSRPFVYQVVEKNIIRTFAASAEAYDYLQSVTQPTSNEQLTLITCWPRWTNTHRLIVIAEPKQVVSLVH